jgi:hypothetical protein
MRRFVATTLVLGTLLGCKAKVSNFDDPYMHEVFLGAVAISVSVKGLSSGALAVSAVAFVGDGTGKQVTIYGVPQNEPFPVIPKDLFDAVKKSKYDLPPTISGFSADVIDAHTVKVSGIAWMSDSAKDLELEATGTIVRQGPQVATTQDDPIVIRAKVRPLRSLVPEEVLSRIQTIQDSKPITEMGDSEMIPIYRIDFRPEITTVF